MSKLLGKLPEPPGPEEPAPPLQAGFPMMGAGGKLPILGNDTFLGPGKGLELTQLPLRAQQLLMALPGVPSSLPGKEIPGLTSVESCGCSLSLSLLALFPLWEDTVLPGSSAPGKFRGSCSPRGLQKPQDGSGLCFPGASGIRCHQGALYNQCALM